MANLLFHIPSLFASERYTLFRNQRKHYTQGNMIIMVF